METEPSRDQGYAILSYLLAGLLLYGGLGWLADKYFHTVIWTPIGMIAGFGLSLYLVAKRYGNGGGTPQDKTKESK